MDYAAFLELLAKDGFSFVEHEKAPAEHSILSVGYTTIYIDGKSITIYEYVSNALMETDSDYIDKSGHLISFPDRDIENTYISYPHFFKKDKIIVRFIGADERILKFLKTNLGGAFAGYSYTNQAR